MIQASFPEARVYSLLKNDVYLELSRNPAKIREDLDALLTPPPLVVIDEIQRLPELLNEVHYLIEAKKIRFLMTGSNPRKLRAKGENLLGGRARSRYLHPFSVSELPDLALDNVFQRGLIPSIYFSDSPDEDLKAYVGDYLGTEIAAEGLVRNIPGFSRFLEVAALSNTTTLNLTKMSNDVLVSRTALQEYFQILRDTLLAYDLCLWKEKPARKPKNTRKFFFFDVGVARALQGRKSITPGTPEYGQFFEAYLFHELRTWLDYNQGESLHYWANGKTEVDFILNGEVAIEAKAKKRLSQDDFSGLERLGEEASVRRRIIACFEAERRNVGKIEVWPWREFLLALWAGEI